MNVFEIHWKFVPQAKLPYLYHRRCAVFANHGLFQQTEIQELQTLVRRQVPIRLNNIIQGKIKVYLCNRKYQCQVTMYALGFQSLGCPNPLPRARNFNEHTFLWYSFLCIKLNDGSCPLDRRLSVMRKTGVDFCGYTAGDML